MRQPTMKHLRLELLCLVLASLLSACHTPVSLSSRYQILAEKPDGGPLSTRVLLVADNQLSHLYGDPQWMRTEVIDRIVSVAIRPVQQDLFGQDILRWVLEYFGSRPVIHLGDGMNMACTGEFDAFLRIMSSAKKVWVMAPGNHDAYFFGNTQENLGEWEAACRRAGGPMTKALFAERYLESLKEGFADFRAAYPGRVPSSGEWHAPDGANAFLRAVAWEIDEHTPWRSFLLQEVDLSYDRASQSVSAFLLDTNQYAEAPTLIPTPLTSNAGITGDLQPNQLEILRRWLDQARSHKPITVLMGHHPFGTLRARARDALDSMRRNYSVALFVSAHTHDPQYFTHGDRGDGWLELNIGSIVDWPIEFRTLSVHQIRNDPSRMLFRLPPFRIPDEWDNHSPPDGARCRPEWERETHAPDFYLSLTYKSSPSAEESQRDILNAILQTYRRYFNTFPSTPDPMTRPACCGSNQEILKAIDAALGDRDPEKKISLLMDLEAFDRRRPPDSARRDYRLCQAVWASKYDKLRQRSPAGTDLYIAFPRE